MNAERSSVTFPGTAGAPSCKDGELRISEGNAGHGGYLEYCYNNDFGVVCGNNFDDRDAQVACRQLGYSAKGNRSFCQLKAG